MQSKLAEQLREEQIAEIRRMSPSERVDLVRRMFQTGVELYAAGQRIDRETAIARIQRSRQIGRRYSRCMDESLQ